MRYFTIFLLLFFWHLTKSQLLYNPNYSENESVGKKILSTDDINLFPYNSIQYIGKPKKKININVNNFYGYNPLIKNNYSSNSKDAIVFFKSEYENIKIFADVTQKTPLKITEITISDAEIDKYLSENKESEIPKINYFYDGFPVTVQNNNENNVLVGFGNTLPLSLEAKDKNGDWKTVYDYRKYTCGNGIKVILLKPNQILTVFVPRLNGDFKTTLRFRLKNVISNEFVGNINYKYIQD